VDIRIGITNSPREISFESSQTAAEVEALVAAALEAGSPFVKLTDNKGKIFIVPSSSFAYIELGSEAGRRVGFVA
jgi:predicted RNA-binding protein (virulence factor B family)